MDFSKLTQEDLLRLNTIDNLKKSFYNCVGVVSYNNGENGTSIGTGTLVIKHFDAENAKIYLITNKHVIPKFTDAQHITFKIHAPWKEDIPFYEIDVSIYDKNQNLKDHVQFHNGGEDIAVIDFTAPFVYSDIKKLEKDLIKFEMLANEDRITERNLTIGDDVYFIGYPSFFFDDRNATPLVRKGTI